jgi:transcriptional regulator NrdR family protein
MVIKVQQYEDRNKLSSEIERLTMKSTVSAESLKSLINSITSEFEETFVTR